MKTKSLLICGALLLPALGGCTAVQHTSTQLQALPASPVVQPRTLAHGIDIRLGTGYTRSLKAGTLWRQAGSIDQGEVYRPVQDVFTLEGAHIHEAYLVIREDTLTGFYLPAERGFSPLQPAVPIHFK